MIKRTAVAAWAGGLKDGIGTVSCESGVLSNTRYGYRARHEDTPGTNPEELLAAAQAACFAMALSAELEELRLVAKTVRIAATVTLDKSGDGYSIGSMHLDLDARIPGLDQRSFEMVVNRAKLNCAIAKLLAVPVTVQATLEL